MSDQGEKTCPLCAEEMDLTDQQLKPCKCGYEICVWCWHHIMDMAEKDETDGRCPACRTPYNKEKIVGMAPTCEKIVAEMNMEKKLKSHKGKSKTSESRKQLCSVRVIQRNLVYIVGLPLNLADEDLLQNNDYFAQYGKVSKVSISRTAAGAIQHFPNNTCSVYITYSKEEEAVRCIQSVHGFVLEGRPLKACFGTTKYCHAWLRNVPCTNPDCLYLHEIGSQEDSFTKDEIISAYTRSRVQQISGATNIMQRRSGSILPPPADNYCNNSFASTAKPISKGTTTNSATSTRVSPPNSSSGRSAALPAGASWGTRASNNQPPPATSLPHSNKTLKSKPEMCNSAATFSAAVASTSQCSSLHADRDKQPSHVDESSNNQDRRKIETPEPARQYVEADDHDYVTETPPTPVLHCGSSTNGQIHSHPAAKEKDWHMTKQTNNASSFDRALMPDGPDTAKVLAEAADYEIGQLCSDMSSLSNDRHQNVDQSSNPLTSVGKAATCAAYESCMTNEKSNSRLDLQMQVVTRGNGDGSHSSDDLKSGIRDAIPDRGHTPSESFNFSTQSPFLTNTIGSVGANMHIVDRNCDSLLQPSSFQGMSNGYQEKNIVNCYADVGSTNRGSSSLPNADQRKYGNSFEGETTTADCNGVVDMGESSIISNILSLDFDPWDAPLTSPQNLANLLGDSDQQPNLRLSNSLKLHTSNQSRFSFAREEKPINQAPGFEPSLTHTQQVFNHSLSHDYSNSRSFQLDNPGPRNGFSLINNEDYNSFPGNYSTFSSNKLSVSRSQMSAPPGFSAPNRAPPPGFASHERVEQNFASLSGNQLLDTVLRNQYQNPPAGYMADNDGFELTDPAILAVGKEKIPSGNNFPGMDLGQNFPPQLSTFDNEARLQLLMQRSLPPHPNQRLADTGDNFSSFHDAYGIPSRAGEQTLGSNLPQFSQFSLPQSRNPVMSNGHWDVWNGVNSGNDLGMAELFRTERVGGLNNFYSGYDESKFRAPNSGSFYNRTFGI